MNFLKNLIIISSIISILSIVGCSNNISGFSPETETETTTTDTTTNDNPLVVIDIIETVIINGELIGGPNDG